MTEHPRRGLPLRVDPTALEARAVRSLCRAVQAVALRKLDRRAALPWRDDDAAEMIMRGARPPLSTADTGAINQIVPHFLRSLTPLSAGAAVLAAGIGLDFDGATAISLPSIGPITAAWVSEGSPIPSRAGQTSGGPQIVPFKLATLVSLTGEMIRNTNAEQMIRMALSDAVAPSLDAALFSNAAAVAGKSPAGLLNGLTPLAASTAVPPSEAMADDLGNLAQAVAPLSGNGSICYVTAPKQQMRIMLTAENAPQVFASVQIPAGTIICIALPGLVSVAEALPLIDASTEALVHEEGANAQPIVTPAGTLAYPVRSEWQSDSVSLRLRLPISWQLRAPGAVAFVQATTW